MQPDQVLLLSLDLVSNDVISGGSKGWGDGEPTPTIFCDILTTQPPNVPSKDVDGHRPHIWGFDSLTAYFDS